MAFEQVVRDLDRLGVTQVVLPFFLIFALVFGILQSVKLFKTGKDKDAPANKAVNVVLALVIAGATVFMHILYPGSPYNVIPMIQGALPWVAVFLVMLLVSHIGYGLVTGGLFQPSKRIGIGRWIPLGTAIIVTFIFVQANTTLNFPYWLQNLTNGPGLYMIIAAVVFFALISFITGGNGNLGDQINKLKAKKKELEDKPTDTEKEYIKILDKKIEKLEAKKAAADSEGDSDP